ncbi:MAG: right-handed parallel beta-helix repeat-containing protein [Candidatus Micrarchaeia archaeon]
MRECSTCLRLFVLAFAVLSLAISVSFAYTNISACGIYDTPYTEYRINDTLYGIIHPSMPVCLLFNTSNIIIDCQGNEIDGTGAFDAIAVFIGDPNDFFGGSSVINTNITFKNCSIHDYLNYVPAPGASTPIAIWMYKLNNTTVQNVDIYGNNKSIMAYIVNNITLADSKIHNNEETGFEVFAGNNTRLIRNVIYNNDKGASFGSSINLTVFNNTIYGNNDIGIQIGTISSANISKNIIFNNGNYGIGGGTIAYSSFHNNTISFNNNAGIIFSGVLSSNITSNRILSNNNTVSGFAQGIGLFDSSTGNIIAYNTLYNNSGHGIDIGSGSSNNLIYNNSISHCTNGMGINVDSSSLNSIIGNNVSNINNILGFGTGVGIFKSHYTRLENNTISGSTGFGIYLKGSKNCNITNNTAYNNGGQNIMLDSSSIYTRILRNHLLGGSNSIMLMNGSGHNLISSNYISGSQYDAIGSQRAWSPGPSDSPTPNITIINNTIFLSGTNAIHLIESNGSTVKDNIISSSTGPFSTGIMLDNTSKCVLDNNTISYFPVNAILLKDNSKENVISNSIFHSIAYGYSWAYAIQFSNSTPSTFPDANAFYNTTLYNTSRYVGFSWDFSGYRPQNFTNLTLCNDNSLSTCIMFSFRQITNAFLGYQGGGGIDNLFIGADFVSMDGTHWGASQFDGPANVTLLVSGCSNPNDFTIYRSPVSLPLSRADVLSTGIEFIPGYRECISSTKLRFNATSFSGYAAVNKYENSFNMTISSPGVTRLSRDYSQGSATLAIIGITSSNVILDLNGYNVRDGATGVYVVPGLKNITIMNGTIFNTTRAIVVNSSNNTHIRGVVIYNISTGIYLDPSYNNTIIGNMIFNGTQYGIEMDNSHNNTVANNTIFSILAGTGIYSKDGSNNTFLNNTIYNCTYGINIEYGTRDRVTLNDIYNFTNGAGIRIENSAHALVNLNRIHSFGSRGALIISTNYSAFNNNRFYNIPNICVEITQNSDHNQVSGNNFTRCDLAFISEWNINNLTLSNSNVSNCLYGIWLIDTNQSELIGTSIYNTPQGFAVNASSHINFTGSWVVNSTTAFYIYGNKTSISRDLRIRDTSVFNSYMVLNLSNATQSVLIDNLTSTNNNKSVQAVFADDLTISNSKFTLHRASTDNNVFNPLAVVRIANSTNIRIENSSFHKNNITSVLFWGTYNIRMRHVNITYSNASVAAFGDRAHIYLYPNVYNVNISYLNCSNGGIEYGGICFHNHGNVSNVWIDRSVFYNMTGGIEGRIPGSDPYGNYFIGYAEKFKVTNCSFDNLFHALYVHAHNTTLQDNNITNNFRGSGIRFKHFIMRNNKFVNNFENFGLAYDDGEVMGPIVHDYFEHDIDTSNTINGKPIYYYCSWAGNDKHNYVETNTNGGYYACIDCSNVIFENLSITSVSHVVYIGFSDNVTVRNVTGETLQGIKFFVTQNSRAYNNTFKRLNNVDPFLPILPPDYVGNMRAINLIWSKNISISNSTSDKNLQCLYMMFTNNTQVSNVSCINSVVVPSIVMFGAWNNIFDNIRLQNLTGRYPLYVYQGWGIPEGVVVIAQSKNNTFNNMNISQVNLTNRVYYISLQGSHTLVNNSRFNHTHISFSDIDVVISNTTMPSALLPFGVDHLLATPPLFLEIQNTSPTSRLNLTFYYEDTMVPPGHSEFDIRIWKYSSSAGSWQRKGFIARQELNPILNTITAYEITNFSSPFGPLAETLQCVNLSDNSTWEGRLTNISGVSPIQLMVNAPIILCKDTYHIPAFWNSTNDGYLFLFTTKSGLDCNGSTLIGNRNGTAMFVYSGVPAYIENITIRNCTFMNYRAGFEAAYPARNILILDNIFRNFTADSGKQPHGINFGEDANNYNHFNNIWIVNNTIENFRSELDDGETVSGIILGDSMNKSSGFVIANNTIRNITLDVPGPASSKVFGILMISGPSAGNLSNVTIRGNTIKDLSATASGVMVGGIVDFGTTNSTIYDNHIYNLLGRDVAGGILILGSYNNNYTDNSIQNISGGIGFTAAAIMSQNAIGNRHVRNFVYNTSKGIFVDQNSNRTLVAYNKIVNCSSSDGNGIYIRNSHYANVSSNNITRCYDGISLDQSSLNNVSWNRVVFASRGIVIGGNYNNLLYNRVYNSSVIGVYIGGIFTGTRLAHDIIQESGMMDLQVIDSPYYAICNTTLQNVTGSGNRPILFVNVPTNLANGQYSELVLCGAIRANVTNTTLHGSDTLQNNGLIILFSNHSRINALRSEGNFLGAYVYRTHYANLTNNTFGDNLYGIVMENAIANNIHIGEVYGSMASIYFNQDSDWNNISDVSMHDPALSVFPMIIFSSAGANQPEFNRLSDVLIYNASFYIGYSTTFANSNNFTNLSVCVDSSEAGCVKWGFANITYAYLTNGTNIIVDKEFVSLNSSHSGAAQLNKSATITINVSDCGPESGVGVLRAEGFPKSKAEILAAGYEYSPASQVCLTPNTMRFSVTSFSGYTESPSYTIITLVDGKQTTSFYNSGEPYNLTVRLKYFNGTGVPNSEVRIYEYNGYLPFALPQYTISNVSNYVYAKSHTDGHGNISLTVVPTGAAEVLAERVGAYNITVRAYKNGIHKGTVAMTVSRRNLPYANSSAVSVPNRGNVGYFNDDVYRVYSRVKEWLTLGGSGGGEKLNIIVYTNGTVVGNNYPLRAGKPYGLNVTVLNHITLVPIPNARVQVTEQNGLPPLALPQYTNTNVSNIGIGYSNTTASGSALISFVPTGSPNLEPSPLPEQYNASLQVYVGGTLVADAPLNVTSRSLSYTPSGPTVQVYNQGNIGTFNDKVYVVYTRILQWLSNH